MFFLSQGSVCRVKKKASAIGGSARDVFVQQRKDEKEKQMTRPTCLECGLSFLEGWRKALVGSPRCHSLLATEQRKGRNRKVLATRTSSLIDYENSNNSKRERYYALKSLHLDRCSNATLQKELKNEVAILKELDHPHIVKALETFDFEARLYICLELCSGGDLYARDPYSEEDAARILTDILSAVAYLHSKGIVHRDLKYENIMVCNQSVSQASLFPAIHLTCCCCFILTWTAVRRQAS